MATSSHSRLIDPDTQHTDLTGRRAIVTGGSSGLGLVTARALSRLGATVVIGVRDTHRGNDARRRLIDDDGVPAQQIEVAHLDLLDLDSVERFSASAGAAPIDLLVLNAASSSVPFRQSREGVESQFATNHLGHFALTGRLLDSLAKGVNSRVVTVSSALYTSGKLDLDGLYGSAGYSPGRAYIRSKLANTIFAVELGRRLTAAGSPIRSFAAHPGMARTPLHGTYPSLATRITTRLLAQLIGREPAPAAVGILAAATLPDVTPDLFWGPKGSKTIPDALGVPFAAVATDPGTATALWTASQRITTIGYLEE